MRTWKLVVIMAVAALAACLAASARKRPAILRPGLHRALRGRRCILGGRIG